MYAQLQTLVFLYAVNHVGAFVSTRTQFIRRFSHGKEMERATHWEMAAEDHIEKLKKQAKAAKLEADKLEAEINLFKISKLEKKLQSSKLLDGESMGKTILDVKSEINALARRVDPSLSLDAELDIRAKDWTKSGMENSLTKFDEKLDNSERVKTNTNLYASRSVEKKKSLTEADFKSAVELFNSLPFPIRRALARSIDLDLERSDSSIVVLGLYELDETLSDTKLQKLYEDEKTRLVQEGRTTEKIPKEKKTESEVDNPFNPWMISNPDKETDVNNMVENIFPGVVRKEGLEPSQIDVEVLTSKILGKNSFQPSGLPEKIPGGYLLRGSMAPKLKNNGDDLIKKIDQSLDSIAPKWNEKYQVSYIRDPTPAMLEDVSLNGAAVLMVHSRDMAPTTNTLFNTFVSTMSLFLGFIFALSCFGQNEMVMNQLTTTNATTNYDLTWFNQLINPLLLSLGTSQGLHELAHLFVSKKEGFKVSPPTILPSLALPYLSFQNRIKTSPKNFDQLFNFACAGPAVGLVSSFVFLFIGLHLTLQMDSTQIQYSPSIPVGFLNLSSLVGNIVEYVLSGGSGDGIILKQDASTPIQLHPYAIGGYAGVMINALDLIPIAGTDGGRMSQALLGRPGHLAFSSVVYGALVIYTIFTGHTDIILGYLFVNSFSQKELEIPTRNEVDQAGLAKATFALVLWCTAILSLVPTS